MAHPAATLSRRLASCSFRAPRPLQSHSPCRLFSSTAPASRHPTLADIHSDGAAEFDAKQQEFRDRLAAAKAQADRKPKSQSPSHAPPNSPVRDAAAGSIANPAVPDAHVPDSRPHHGLGSFSTDTGEHREAARSQDNSAPPSASDADKKGKRKGMLSSIVYGTDEGRAHDREIERSFSQVLARGKYVHSIVFHEVKPDKVNEYIELCGSWYPKVAGDPSNKVNLVGSWRSEVGECDTFVHIWEYQRYHGYHDSLNTIQSRPEFVEFDQKLRTLINNKRTSLMQEFSFWPTTPPRRLGGIFELRSYTLHPGNLLEWETHWRKGLAARREVMEGVGAWFVQVGELNTVHHLWQFADLEERKQRRERSWAVEGWGDTVHKTVPLIQQMQSRIMIPMAWSPVG